VVDDGVWADWVGEVDSRMDWPNGPKPGYSTHYRRLSRQVEHTDQLREQRARSTFAQ
jgi:hypothetical protein